MTTVDPLDGAWKLPNQLENWGRQCSPPLLNPWLSQINFDRSPVEFMSVGRLLLPEFVEFRDGVFLKFQFTEQKFSQWFEKLSNVTAVESILNHIHVYDVFGHADSATEEEFLQAAKLLQRSWEIALSTVFPNSQFNVTLQNSDQDYGPVVSFCKQR